MLSSLARILKRRGSGRVTTRKVFFARRFKCKGVSCWKSRARRGRRRRRRRRRKVSGEERIETFVEWCKDVGIGLHPNVYIGEEGSCDGLGIVAKASISQGECVALIPRSTLLSGVNSSIRELLTSHKMVHESISSWIPLLLSLAAEYSSKSSSKWYPYLSLVPNETNTLPMLWVESERARLLEGTGIEACIKMDINKIETDFETFVRPFMEEYPEIFKKTLCCHQVYKKLVAFVMSYSFTDEKAEFLGRTMMVPFVDILNHASNHHVELTFHPRYLKLMAIRDIEKGEEVMNTYGELSNASLFHVYGFTEDNNPHDEALMTSELVKEVYLQDSSNSTNWDNIDAMGMLEDVYTINIDGTPDSPLLILTRLLHTKEKLNKIMHKCLYPHAIEECFIGELDFLKRLAECSLDGYPEQISTLTPTSCIPVAMTTRERHALRVTLGQQNSLRKFISKLNLLSSNHEL